MKKLEPKHWIIIVVVLAVLLASIVVGAVYLYRQLTETRAELARTQSSLAGANQEIEWLRNTKAGVEINLQSEKSKNEFFESKIGELTGAVNHLDELSKLDEELLKKYSKVYFLNENYLPEALLSIQTAFILNPKKDIQIHSKVHPYLEAMMKRATDDSIDLKILSGYRSFKEQSSLKKNYTVTYGVGANKFSADQGYSEHQLGTTIDFTTSKLGDNLTSFAKTESYKWLLAHAYEYGFVLSYPEGNKYYIFEPWHWRFVGRGLARDLYEQKSQFYDLDQRALDSYLIGIFR